MVDCYEALIQQQQINNAGTTNAAGSTASALIKQAEIAALIKEGQAAVLVPGIANKMGELMFDGLPHYTT